MSESHKKLGTIIASREEKKGKGPAKKDTDAVEEISEITQSLSTFLGTMSAYKSRINRHAESLLELPRTEAQGHEAKRVAGKFKDLITSIKTICASDESDKTKHAQIIAEIKEFQDRIVKPTIKGEHPPEKKRTHTSGDGAAIAVSLLSALAGSGASVGSSSTYRLPPQVSKDLKGYCEFVDGLCDKEKVTLSVAHEAPWVTRLKEAIKQNFKLLDKNKRFFRAEEFDPDSLAGTARRIWDICNDPHISNTEKKEQIQTAINQKIAPQTTIENATEPKYAFYAATRLALESSSKHVKIDTALAKNLSSSKVFGDKAPVISQASSEESKTKEPTESESRRLTPH